ncbi:S-type pyocin domain-containing protein [Yersinia proxima]|uniref:S-type pyocin domain-containing protein n=1 Tax=Yersinia proxima TaxID=2890316 RepID=A0ABW9F2R6_9GAMM
MGEGHSNTTGHGARGPTGGVKGGPAGPGGPGSNRGQGWGTSQTPYGAIHHYSPSQFGHSSQRGGGRGGDRGSQAAPANLAQNPELQTYMAVGGMPAVITLIDGNWGVTLSRLPAVAAFIEGHLARVGSWLMRTSPIGVAVMGIMPSRIASDPPIGQFFTTSTLPANRVTDTPKETLKAVADVAVNIRLSDVTEEGVQKAVLIKAPIAIQRVPVIKAVTTTRPDVFIAAIPGITPIHISVVDTIPSNIPAPAQPAARPTVTPIENAVPQEFNISVGRHSRDAIIVFPDGTGVEPLYLSVIRITNVDELMQEARNTYEIARREREAAERAMAQSFTSVPDELKLKKTLTDKQVTETAAHIILLESNKVLLQQEEAQAVRRSEYLIHIREKFLYVKEISRLRALALAKQREINTLNHSIAELRNKQGTLFALQRRVHAELEIAQAAERLRVEHARLAAEAAERQRIEHARLAAEAAERKRVENVRQVAEAAERRRVENARLAAEAAERKRVENARLAAEAAERQRVENARRAAELEERERIRNERLVAEIAAWQKRVTNPRLTTEAAEQWRIKDEQLTFEEAKWQFYESKRLIAEEAQRLQLEERRITAELEWQVVKSEIFSVDEDTKQQARVALHSWLVFIRRNTFSLPVLHQWQLPQHGFAVGGKASVTLTPEVASGLKESYLKAQEQLSRLATQPIAEPCAVIFATGFQQEKSGDVDHSTGWDSSLALAGSVNLRRMGYYSSITRLPRQGEIDLPVRILMRDHDGRLDIYAVKTGVANVPDKVKIGVAEFDKSKGAYTFITDSTPPRTFIFTPAEPPGAEISPVLSPPDSAPISPQHTGEIEIQPVVTPAILPLPQLDEGDFHDYIIWFPAESGLEPVYVYFNSPYGKTTAKGKYSGRPYNPDKSGGLIQHLDWKDTKINRTGVDKVKLHTKRFGELEDNKLMIERLERILMGELAATDIDKRFYTHEIRELERYRALGVSDGVEDESVWNDAHTATLEDYKINEKTQPLYTPKRRRRMKKLS